MAEVRKRQKKGDKHYVNNAEFTAALHEYSQECRTANDAGIPEPRMSDYIGGCILKMANRLSLTPRFRGYPFREEMVGDAVIAAVKYAKNFDGRRFDNAFAYVTQILFSHMIMTIKKEKRKYQTNMELIANAQLESFGIEELDGSAAQHAQMIADQKLKSIEESSAETPAGQKGFRLRTGYTKEERESYEGGTPFEE
jgi:hypothetical protein